jgi:hypothetical protein
MSVGVTPPQPASPPPNLPGWLGSAVQVTTQLGFPAVVAGVLLWFVLTRVGSTLEGINQAEEDRTKMLAAMQDTMIAALDRQGAVIEKAIHENMSVNQNLAAELRATLAVRRHDDSERRP